MSLSFLFTVLLFLPHIICILYYSCIYITSTHNKIIIIIINDTYAPSHLAQSTMVAGAVASQAEDRKKVKYSYLDGHPGICFTPIAYETSAVVGPLSQIFLKELGHRLSATTGDTKSYSYLLQRLSVAVQRGNAASILGTLFSPTFTDF